MATFWDSLLDVLQLVGDEKKSERLYHIGSGYTDDGRSSDLFIRPCLTCFIRLDWKRQPINCRSIQVDLSICDAEGVLIALVEKMQWWSLGSLPDSFDKWTVNNTGEALPIWSRGTPRQWLTYETTPLRQCFSSLYEYQLFDFDDTFRKSTQDCGQLVQDWYDHSREIKDIDAHPSGWEFDPLSQRYRHQETGDKILRVHKQWSAQRTKKK